MSAATKRLRPPAKTKRFTLPRQPRCSQCVTLIEEVKRLREENQLLKAKVRYQQRKIDEGYFGASTPSSQKPFKANAKAKPDNGGARKGHQGHGRRAFTPTQVETVIPVDTESTCPDCQVKLVDVETRTRSVLELVPVEVKKVVYKLHRRRCPCCRRTFRAQAPGVLPKFKLSNSFLAHVATEHYLHGVTMGHLAKRLGVGQGTLFASMHRLAHLLEGALDQLIAEYRQAAVKHADETGWRYDGHNGYVYLFCSPTISIFQFHKTRAASVVEHVLGKEPLPGTLVVDRYKAYNKAPCPLQYCYSHLLREVQELEKQFPKKREVQQFVAATAPLLARAMQLRTRPISDEAFYEQAQQLKAQIQEVMDRQAQHAGIQNIQDIFREHPHRLYHWAEARAIPADNNFAERELRPLVIARKISFGSQSDAGAKTREILMSILHTLSKRKGGEVMMHLKASLDRLAADPTQGPYQILFVPPDTS